MAVLIKCDPVEILASNTRLEFEEKVFGDTEMQVGEEVFIWTNETKKGQGLVALGILEDADQGKPLNVRISCVSESGGVLKNDQLKKFRNASTNTPITTLAKKLYRQAHSKVTSLTSEEARFARHLISMR